MKLTTDASALGSTDHLAGEIQHALARLADVETDIETERERLERWAGPTQEKARLLMQLEAERQRRREPLAQRLAELHRHMTACTRLRPLH